MNKNHDNIKYLQEWILWHSLDENYDNINKYKIEIEISTIVYFIKY